MTKPNGHGSTDVQRESVKALLLSKIPHLCSYAIALSGNTDRADDLTQETLIKALQNLASFEPGTNMEAWLVTICRNVYRSEYRKRKREQEWNPVFENVLALSTGLGESEAEVSHDYRHLLLLIACLPRKQSNSLIAIGYLGLSHETTAEIFGCAVGTVKSQVNRARVELEQMMRDGSKVKSIDLTRLKSATADVPHSHPFYPIAKAYVELYHAFVETDHGIVDAGIDMLSKSEEAWRKIVASGALDEQPEHMSDY